MTDHQNSSAESAGLPFQKRVVNWLMECFSMEVCRDGTERNHRFLEESLELVQSLGCTASEAHQLVDYVFGRPVGEPDQELGGVQVTLAALCFPHDLDMDAARERELARVWTKIDKIRAKQAAKPKHSPLPEHVPADAQPVAKPGACPWCGFEDGRHHPWCRSPALPALPHNTVLQPPAAPVGMDWTLSDEAMQQIDEINRNIREAPANLVLLSAGALDYLDALSGARKAAMESHASMLPRSSAGSWGTAEFQAEISRLKELGVAKDDEIHRLRSALPRPLRMEDVRQLAEISIRTFCQSLGAGAVSISSDGVERIYYAGISLKALSVAVAMAVSRPVLLRDQEAGK